MLPNRESGPQNQPRANVAVRRWAAGRWSIGGGVARNQLLRDEIAGDPVLSELEQVFPPMELCTDNAAMIAGLGTHLFQTGHVDDLSLDARATARR